LTPGPFFLKFLTPVPGPKEKPRILLDSTPAPGSGPTPGRSRDDHSISALQVGYPAGQWVCNRIRISKNCFQTETECRSGYPKRFYR